MTKSNSDAATKDGLVANTNVSIRYLIEFFKIVISSSSLVHQQLENNRHSSAAFVLEAVCEPFGA